MTWARIGVTIAVFVASLVVLGRASDLVVDWAWFSTIGYVGVFWTIFATKAFLFIAVFAVSTLLLWVNGTLAVRFASRRRLPLPAVRAPDFATVRALPGTPADLLALVLAAAAAASDHSCRRARDRTADRDWRDRSMGPDPPVHLPGAVRPK